MIYIIHICMYITRRVLRKHNFHIFITIKKISAWLYFYDMKRLIKDGELLKLIDEMVSKYPKLTNNLIHQSNVDIRW